MVGRRCLHKEWSISGKEGPISGTKFSFTSRWACIRGGLQAGGGGGGRL